MDNQLPFLQFDFANSEGKGDAIQFLNPSEIIIAETIDDVLPCFQRVKQAIQNGYYAAGFLSYEAAPAFNDHFQVHHDVKMPLLWFGIFENYQPGTVRNDGNYQTSEWKPSISMEKYLTNIDKIQTHIKQNKTKQVNYTMALQSNFTGDVEAYYYDLQQAQAAKYTACLKTDDFSIVSVSPELFFSLHANQITVKPMKGTVPRGNTYEQDTENSHWLHNSSKNRFENELIVQLMKEELTKIAEPNSIAIDSLYEIEKYPTVYQMTSTLKATISPETSIVDIFKALFPCGSITGFPKKETMDIIAKLETTSRNVYCGTIGYITPAKEAIFNVGIRTVTINHKNGLAHYGVGGGITINSNSREEYEEALAKAAILHKQQKSFSLLETIGLFNGEYFILDYHLDRLHKSAIYFDFNINIVEIKLALKQFAQKRPTDHYRVRLVVEKNGTYTINAAKISDGQHQPLYVTLATRPINRDNVFLYHKTTNRTIYEAAKNMHQNVYDVLLWNQANEVTEFTTGNLVIELDGKLITPMITSGLLAGTFRKMLIDEGNITEQNIKLADLNRCTKMWFINSVRKWVPVQLI